MASSRSRWVRNASDERAVSEGCRFDERAADKVVRFFRKFLRHSKGRWAGRPFEPMDWQREDILFPLFGWKRADGRRRFTRAYVEIPKKNGKSTIASGIGLYLLAGDGEQGAEVYSVAADREQASIVHGEAVRMVDASPVLAANLQINHSTKNILFRETNSWYKAISSEANTKEGLNAHGLIVDELHAWKGRGLWDALRYAGRARSQPLLFAITTAGDDPHSVCREQHDYARGVLRGEVPDVRLFAYIRAARQVSEGDDADDDWTDPQTWRRANPAFGVTIAEDEFAADVREAERSPSGQASFKRYGLNIWSTAVTPWLRADHWAACRSDHTAESLRGRECYGGLDLSKTQDMTALVLCFPEPDGAYRLLAWFWLPEDRVREPDAPSQYRAWAERGFLETTPGGVCDYSFVRRRVREIRDAYDLRVVAYDPYNAESLTQTLEEEDGVKREQFPQTVGHFAEPTGEFERLVMAGKLLHDGNPILAWQAGHAQVRTDANNNKRPVKPRHHDPRKIDGIVAAVMALDKAMSAASESVYDTDGIFYL